MLTFQPLKAVSVLEDYVDRPDEHFNYKVLSLQNVEGLDYYVLELTSQKWRDTSEVNRAIWTHYLEVYGPDKIEHFNGSAWIC